MKILSSYHSASDVLRNCDSLPPTCGVPKSTSHSGNKPLPRAQPEDIKLLVQMTSRPLTHTLHSLLQIPTAVKDVLFEELPVPTSFPGQLVKTTYRVYETHTATPACYFFSYSVGVCFLPVAIQYPERVSALCVWLS